MDLRCRALLFDLDGVLVDSRRSVERTWRRWAGRHGLAPEALLAVAHGRRTRDTLKAAVPHLDPGPEVEWLDAAELEDLEGIVAVPGASRLVGSLPPEVWAIVTSCGRELARRRLQRAGVPAPPLTVTSEDVAHGKPAPDGYLLAASELGVAPAECVVFEDAPPGIAAARAAGARVVALATTHAPELLAGSDAVIRDLTSVVVTPDAGGLLVRT
jgi:sugar-phosphatase